MNDFITGLQFLTRIHLVRETKWSSESFGHSVKYFPAVGAVLGLLYALIAVFGQTYLPTHMQAVIIVAAGIILTGGLHCDGLMDTADGLFSGRDRERMLDIMKDSRVGANGVVAILLLILFKWSIILDTDSKQLPYLLFAMPIIGRLAMVMSITLFPYARQEGIGKLFTQYTEKSSLTVACLFTILLLLMLDKHIWIASVLSICFAFIFNNYAVKKLGGLTGDIYGATAELTEAVYLFVAAIL